MKSDPLEDSVICFDLDSELVALPKSLVVFRPVAHGIIILNEAALLETNPQTKRWQPLTAELVAGQGLELALKQQLREQITVPIQIGPLLFAETHYLTENREIGWQISRHYYLLLPVNDDLADSADLIQANAPLTWQPIDELTRAQMQCGYDALLAARNLLKRIGK